MMRSGRGKHGAWSTAAERDQAADIVAPWQRLRRCYGTFNLDCCAPLTRLTDVATDQATQVRSRQRNGVREPRRVHPKLGVDRRRVQDSGGTWHFPEPLCRPSPQSTCDRLRTSHGCICLLHYSPSRDCSDVHSCRCSNNQFSYDC